MKTIRASVIIGILLGAALLMPAEQASAHAVYSTYGNVSSTPFFMFHTSPDLSAFTYVGYDPNGFWIKTTTVVSATSANYYLRAYDKCSTGFVYSSSWVAVSGPNYWVRGPGSCITLSQGRCGISH